MSVSRRLEDLEIAAVEDEVLAPQFAAASRVPWDKLHPEHALSIDDEVLVFLEDASLRVKRRGVAVGGEWATVSRGCSFAT